MHNSNLPDASLPGPAAQLREACGRGRWRPAFTNDPAFDKEAEDETWAWQDSYPTILAGIASSHPSPEERQQRCEAAEREFERALSFVEQAEEAGAKLSDIDELAAERQRLSGELRVLRGQLLEFKSLFDAVVRSAHKDGMRIRILLSAISDFSYLVATAAYDAIELRNRTAKIHWIAQRGRRTKKQLTSLEVAHRTLRSRSRHRYPPPNLDGQWTPKEIAEYYGLSVNIVREVARQLAKRPTSNASEAFHSGNPGERRTWNEKQMRRLVKALHESTHKGRRGELK